MNTEELKKAYWMAYAAMQSVREEHTRSLIDDGETPAIARGIWKRSGGNQYIEAAWEARSNCDAHGLRRPERHEKCPLCPDGGKISFEQTLNEMEEVAFMPVCHCCGLALWDCFDSSADALQAWRQFVRKFPEIMRVYPGDKIMTYSGHVRTVKKKSPSTGKITVSSAYKHQSHQNMTGEIEISPNDVELWPWKLDTEGNPKK